MTLASVLAIVTVAMLAVALAAIVFRRSAWDNAPRLPCPSGCKVEEWAPLQRQSDRAHPRFVCGICGAQWTERTEYGEAA